MQEEVPEEEQQTTPRPDRAESPLGDGIEELLAAELTEVAQRGGDPVLEVDVSPLPIPDVPEPIQEIDTPPIFREPEPGINPEPIFRESGVGMNPDPETLDDLGNPIGEVSANPIPIPDVPEPSEMLIRAEEVSDIQIPAKIDSFTDDLSSTQFKIDDVSNNPIPLPSPGMEDGLGGIGTLPVPLPYEADLIENNLGAGMEEEPFEDLLE